MTQCQFTLDETGGVIISDRERPEP